MGNAQSSKTAASGDIVILGVNLNTVNYWYVFYILFSIAVVAGGSYSLYSSATLGKTIIYAVGASLVMVFFGMRWFGNIPEKSNVWPPTINTCPDYLTHNGTGCVDYLGVSSQVGGFPKSTKTTVQYFGGSTTPGPYTSTTVNTAITAADTGRLQAICDACSSGGLTWEGIYDGDTCLVLNRFQATKQFAKATKCTP
uniref:Uncharacterized protein n=1 Tax=viral metagenome TaxID=1070528 RepID=A0A6C0LNZ7_9ZZZZ